MITRIKLKNWRSHTNSEFIFTKGVNALVGIMGSGKSSVMDALCFGLFGSFPLLQARKLKLDDIIRSVPSPVDSLEVEVEFIGHDGVAYTVQRIIKRGKGTVSANLRKERTLIEGPNAQRCTEYISKLLKIDYDVFSRAVYADQNQLDYFLEIPRGQRMARIDKLLHINRFETARKNTLSLIKKISIEQSTKKELTDTLLGSDEIDNLEKIIEEKEKIEEDLQNLNDIHEKHESDFNSHKNQLNELTKKSEQFTQFTQQKNNIDGHIEQLRLIQNKDINDISIYNTNDIENKLKETQNKLATIKSQREKRNELEKSESELHGKKEILSKRFDELKNEIATLSIDPNVSESLSVDGLQKLRDKKQQELSQNIETFTALKFEEQLLANQKEVHDKIFVSKIEIDTQLKNLIQPFESKEGYVESFSYINTKIVDHEHKRDSLKIRRDYADHFLKHLESKHSCPLCKSDLSDSTKNTVLDEQKSFIDQFGTQKSDVDTELEQLYIKKTKFEEVLNTLHQLENKRDSYNQELETISNVQTKLGTLILKIQEVETKIQSIKPELEEIDNKITIISSIESANTEKTSIDTELKLIISRQIELKNQLQSLSLTSDISEKDLENQCTEFQSILDALHLESKITVKIKEQNTLEQQISTLNFNPETLETYRNKVAELRVAEDRFIEQIKSINNLLEEKIKRIDEINKKQDQITLAQSEISKLQYSIENLQKFSTAVQKTQSSLRKEFISIVNTVMSEIWQTLYPYGDLKSARLAIEDGDYVLQVFTNDTWKSVEGQISGGERSISALALRIAFSLALAPNLSWLILDEPTHNLDTTAIEELTVTLRERLPGIIDQIFLITHEERLENAVSGYLYRLDRNKALDEPTQVKKMIGPEIN